MLLEAVDPDEVLEACGTGSARGGARLDGVRGRACFVSPNLFGLQSVSNVLPLGGGVRLVSRARLDTLVLT